MNRMQFMQRLSKLLEDLPDEERFDAVAAVIKGEPESGNMNTASHTYVTGDLGSTYHVNGGTNSYVNSEYSADNVHPANSTYGANNTAPANNADATKGTDDYCAGRGSAWHCNCDCCSSIFNHCNDFCSVCICKFNWCWMHDRRIRHVWHRYLQMCDECCKWADDWRYGICDYSRWYFGMYCCVACMGKSNTCHLPMDWTLL